MVTQEQTKKYPRQQTRKQESGKNNCMNISSNKLARLHTRSAEYVSKRKPYERN